MMSSGLRDLGENLKSCSETSVLRGNGPSRASKGPGGQINKHLRWYAHKGSFNDVRYPRVGMEREDAPLKSRSVNGLESSQVGMNVVNFLPQLGNTLLL
jgi:hypothetical protein